MSFGNICLKNGRSCGNWSVCVRCGGFCRNVSRCVSGVLMFVLSVGVRMWEFVWSVGGCVGSVSVSVGGSVCV